MDAPAGEDVALVQFKANPPNFSVARIVAAVAVAGLLNQRAGTARRPGSLITRMAAAGREYYTKC